MKTDMIDRLVSPYVKHQQLTYDDFDKIFAPFMTHKDEYKIAEYLENKGIELVDELSVAAEDTNDPEEELLSGMDAILELDDSHEGELTGASDILEDEDCPVVYNNIVHQRNATLCMLIQKGSRQAMQDLCVKNRGLVMNYARIYSKKTTFLTINDLEQIGYLGLMRAAKRFELYKGAAFSTYASIWIRQMMRRAIADEETVVRLPIHMCERIYKIQRYDNQFAREGVSDLNQRIRMIALECELPTEKVIESLMYRQRYMRVVSLDLPVGEDYNTFLGELIPDEKTPSVEDTVFAGFLREVLEKVLHTLTSKEEQVLRRRFGFDDGRPRTLEEVGQNFGVTRERIRQIEAKALRKLRHPSRSRKLKDYLD